MEIAEEISEIHWKKISLMFFHVLQIWLPEKEVYVRFSSAAGWTGCILMFYSLEYVFHWHGYHDKASLTVQKGVSRDFCQGRPLWRRVSGCHSAIVQRCALVWVPFFQLREDGSILQDTLEKSRGGDFWSLPWYLKRATNNGRYLKEALFQGPF